MKNKKKFLSIVIALVTVLTTLFSIRPNIANAESNSDLLLELSVGNSWSSGGNTFSQVDVKIINDSNSTKKDWLVTLPLDKNTKIDSSWNVSCDIKDGILSASGTDNNNTISKKSSITFGFILKNAGDIDIASATISTKGASLHTNTPTSNPSDTTDPSPSPSANPSTDDNYIPEKTTDDWLYTDGSKILDKDGKEVWLTGTNWFGYNTGTNTFDGIWSCDLNKTLSAIADRGFNILRVPFSSELILNWKEGKYPKPCYNDFVNDYLAGKNSLEIWDYVVDRCRKEGIKIMIDIHSAETDASGHFAPLWYTSKVSEKEYLESLAWMADRYKDDDTIVAYDLKNEPHGAVGDKQKAIWNDSKDDNNWKYEAEKASMAVLENNPNALVMVEGIQIYPTDISKNSDYSSTNKNDYYNTWWGGNLRGVADYPVNLGKYQNKLVYSPHDYGPSVSDQPWFTKGFDKDSLYKDCWRDNWFYIQENNTAPLLIGEWGGYMTEPNLTWMTALRDFIIENKINHTFWCFNANSGDTGGLVAHDFTTWDETKYNFVKKALWQKGNKFVGLDHKIPLGKNGISLSAY